MTMCSYHMSSISTTWHGLSPTRVRRTVGRKSIFAAPMPTRAALSANLSGLSCIRLRSDHPGGDYDQLMESIARKLMPLDGDVHVLPGHGPATSIGYERVTNPFLQPA